MTTTKRILRGAVGLVLAATAGLGTGGARAQPAAGASSALAEALFQQGRDLFKKEQYAEACAKLGESQRLEPKLGTLFNLALCHEKEGKLATAWAEYASAASIARREGQKEREDFAREQVEALGQKFSHVILRVQAPPPGFTLALDDKPLDAAALSAPLPIDPGKHRVVASAPGKADWRTTFNVPAARVEIGVDIPPLTEAAPTPPAPATSAIPAASAAPLAPLKPTAAPVEPPAPNSTARTLVLAGFGGGAAGVVLAAVTGGLTLGKASSLKDACKDNHCPAEQADTLSSANTLANVANVGLVIGAIGAGVGITGLVLSARGDGAPKPKVGLTIGPGAIGLSGEF